MSVTRIPSEVIEVPDFVTMTEPEPDKPMAELAVALVAMFTEDETLPQPQYLSLSVTGQEIDMQFGSMPDTFHALARWAERFGGTVTGRAPKTCTANRPSAAKSSSPTRACR